MPGGEKVWCIRTIIGLGRKSVEGKERWFDRGKTKVSTGKGGKMGAFGREMNIKRKVGWEEVGRKGRG